MVLLRRWAAAFLMLGLYLVIARSDLSRHTPVVAFLFAGIELM